MGHGIHLVMGLAGCALSAEEAAFIKTHRPAGIILFSRNIAHSGQVVELIRAIRALVSPPPTVWLDQEGGRVQRMRDPLSRFPSPWRLAELESSQPGEALSLAREAGRLCGLELAALGIGIDCAPVLDVREEGADPVIGERAFGGNPAQVVRLAGAWLQGFSPSGVMAVGKHFPGHGAAKVDSHLSLPVVDKSLQACTEWELAPFAQLLPHLPALMTAHLIATALDPRHPATHSPATLTGLLRKAWGYTGLVVSDALEMKALSGTLEQRATLARQAGCDILLCCTGKLADAEETLVGIGKAPASEQERLRIETALAPYRLAPGDLAALLRDPGYREGRRRVEALAEARFSRDVTDTSMGDIG